MHAHVPLLGVPIGVSIHGLILINQFNLCVLNEHEKTDTIFCIKNAENENDVWGAQHPNAGWNNQQLVQPYPTIIVHGWSNF